MLRFEGGSMVTLSHRSPSHRIGDRSGLTHVGHQVLIYVGLVIGKTGVQRVRRLLAADCLPAPRISQRVLDEALRPSYPVPLLHFLAPLRPYGENTLGPRSYVPLARLNQQAHVSKTSLGRQEGWPAANAS